MDGRASALLLSLVMSGCMAAGKLPATTSSDVRSIQKIAVLPVRVPAVPRVRILNSNSDWFHVPGFAAKGAYEAHVGAEVGSLLQSVAFDYGGEAARVFERSIAAAGASVVRPAASALSENRKWPIRKCPVGSLAILPCRYPERHRAFHRSLRKHQSRVAKGVVERGAVLS